MPLDFNVIGKKLPMGFPGTVARQSFNIVETHYNDTTDPVVTYGAPVVMTSAGKVRAFKSGDDEDDIYGYSVRPDAVQLGGANPTDWTDAGIPDPAQPIDILIKGYMNVAVKDSTAPVMGGSVYVFVAAGSDGEKIGEFATTAQTSVTAAIPGAQYMGPADDYGIAQMRVL